MLIWASHQRFVLLVAAALATALCGCGSSGGGGGGGGGAVAVTASLTDDSGKQVSSLPAETPAPVFVGVDGLPPGQDVELMLYKDGAPLYAEPLCLTVDDQGKIPASAILYDVGVDQTTGREIDPAGSYVLHITGQGVDKTVNFTIGSRGSRATEPAVFPLVKDPTGIYIHPRGSVVTGEDVYVKGSNFPASTEVRVYIAADRQEWPSGTPIAEAARANYTAVTTTADGRIPETLVWRGAQVAAGAGRDFDVVVDADGNGVISPGDAVNGHRLTGFTLQDSNFRNYVPMATDRTHTYRNTYDIRDTITVWVNPPGRPPFPNVEAQSRIVGKYVVVYKETWRDGDPLIDVTGRCEWDLVRYACANQYHYPVWSAPLTPGRYDVIVDVNKNGQFDSSTDLIHSLDGTEGGHGIIVAGAGPARLLVSIEPAVVSKGQEATVYVTALAKDTGLPAGGVNVSLSVVDNKGTLSQATVTTAAAGDASGAPVGTAKATLVPGVRGAIVTVKASATGFQEGTGTVRTRAAGDLNVVVR